MELIDKKYVLGALSVFRDIKYGDPRFINGIETAKEIIEDAPTIDFVRCKDCKHWLNKTDNWLNRTDIGWCEINSRMSLDGNWNPFYESDYCSHGVRGTDD